MTEVFFYQSMSYGIVTVTEVTLNSFSVVVMLTFLLSPSFKNEQEGKEKRARKVTAKHYMEGEMLTPEDDDELVQAYKKWK